MAAAQDQKTLQLLEDLLKKAKSFGATEADVVLSDSSSVAITRRNGKAEALKRSEDAEIGLRVFVGNRQAIVSSSDRSAEALEQIAERAVAMAKIVPEDPYAGIAAPDDICKQWPELDLYDPTEVPVEKLIEMADAAEAAAREIKGITNTDGADCGESKDISYYAATNGFVGGYASSGFSLSVSVIAGEGDGMETDYDFDSAVFFKDLANPANIGRNAGTRAVKALKPRKGPTKQMPVVFDRRVAGGLIGSLAGGISGTAVARGTTLLKDKLGQQILPKHINVIDDPFLKRGKRSRPFDGEGICPTRRKIIDNGVLTGWLLDLSSARQLGLKSTGNAGRGASSPPSPRAANFYMEGGALTLEELLKDIDEGFYVTQMMGSGANMVTGDYSRGAKGFWIEKGQITYPVAEMTIAGNIVDMWRDMEIANDLEFKYGVDAPTIRLVRMTVAGA